MHRRERPKPSTRAGEAGMHSLSPWERGWKGPARINRRAWFVVALIVIALVPGAASAQNTEPSGDSTDSRSSWDAVNEHWGSDVNMPMHWIILAAGALLTIIGAVLLIRWWRRRHLRSRPWGVFLRVARTAGVSWRDRWLLVRIARHAGLPTPLTLLLSGSTLRVHGRAYAQIQPPWRRGAVMQRVASLRRDLFGQLGAERKPLTPTAPRAAA